MSEYVPPEPRSLEETQREMDGIVESVRRGIRKDIYRVAAQWVSCIRDNRREVDASTPLSRVCAPCETRSFLEHLAHEAHVSLDMDKDLKTLGVHEERKKFLIFSYTDYTFERETTLGDVAELYVSKVSNE